MHVPAQVTHWTTQHYGWDLHARPIANPPNCRRRAAKSFLAPRRPRGARRESSASSNDASASRP